MQNYNVFHQFRQVKFAYDGSILSSSHFLLLPILSIKMTLSIRVVQIDSNTLRSIIILLT
jgi:hypothetical protein